MDKNEGQCPRFVNNFAFCPYYSEEKKKKDGTTNDIISLPLHRKQKIVSNWKKKSGTIKKVNFDFLKRG